MLPVCNSAGTANDTGGCQRAAFTGTDASAEEIHDWPELSPTERESVAPEYPAPIVDYAEPREVVISTFEDARGDG